PDGDALADQRRFQSPHRQPAGRQDRLRQGRGALTTMRNYLVVLLRTLQREKLYAAINIGGLSLGIACALILGLFLRSELTYDAYHEHASQIYRVVNEFNINGKPDKFAVTSRMLG